MEPRFILVVDDEAHLLVTLRFILEGAGYRVACADSGAAALQAVEEAIGRGTPPDLVISDVQMPGMTGPQLAAELARRGSGTAVLLITGYGDRAKLEDLAASGCADLLEKPFEENELLDRVAALVARGDDARGALP